MKQDRCSFYGFGPESYLEYLTWLMETTTIFKMPNDSLSLYDTLEYVKNTVISLAVCNIIVLNVLF